MVALLVTVNRSVVYAPFQAAFIVYKYLTVKGTGSHLHIFMNKACIYNSYMTLYFLSHGEHELVLVGLFTLP